MSLVQTFLEIEYPESDGQPMGETDLHRRWMERIENLLSHRYQGQRAYVSCDLLVYYEEGEPSKFVVPDDFVVLDCDPQERRIFKTWEEGRVPDVVFEVTSRSTRRADSSFKPGLYAQLGVRELFLYDPTSDYLRPPLQGFRLAEGTYRRIEANAVGAIESVQLGIELRLEDRRLVMRDCRTGDLLRTAAEDAQLQAEHAQARAEQAQVCAEHAEARASQAEERAARLEQELDLLRQQLRRESGGTP